MNKNKIILTLSLSWIIFIGYLTWFNGLKKKGAYLGFNWEEWFWFGVLPVVTLYLLYFIWKPESFRNFISDFKSLFKS
tara:strand:+ start:836 stop:1069 length:234 start_codon:yes stop_codon:yes gene_type:complete